MRPIFACLCLLFSLTSVAGPGKDWIWWHPPTSVSKADRLGYSSNEIAKMTWDHWSDLATTASSDLGPDSAGIVYGVCLAERNNQLLKGRSSSIRTIRGELFPLGMACIALEDTLAGGGTYAVHFPKTLFCDIERTTYDLLRRARKHPSDAKRIARLKAQVTRYATMSKAPLVMLSDTRRASLKDIHFFANQIQVHLDRLLRSMAKLDAYQQNAVAELMEYWMIDYLGIRGADGSK